MYIFNLRTILTYGLCLPMTVSLHQVYDQFETSRILSDSVLDVLFHWEDGGVKGLHLLVSFENQESNFPYCSKNMKNIIDT